MYQEIRLHGHMNNQIEYFATAAARDIYRGYFYEHSGDRLRLFSPGNELVIDPKGVAHRGNGGGFCEYMFGVDQPLADLAKGDVRNRLVLYGATYRDEHELVFSNQTDGYQDYEKIFFEGNAVCNYLFFISGSVTGRLKEQQEGILRLLGKTLKRSPFVKHGKTTGLVEELFSLLGHKSSFYLVSLIHKQHNTYYEAFSRLYLPEKQLSEAAQEELTQLADQLGIDRYQQERIRIDVMYKHPDNQRIVDEYKNILIDCNRQGRISTAENARLTRLKTLSVRNKIPSALFYTLDEMLRHDNLAALEEQDYLAETRQILEGILLHEMEIDSAVTNEDMVRLLRAKKISADNRDHVFEQILLETGKECDEKIHAGADISLLENFSTIITFFDRFDSTSAHVSQLAFMEKSAFAEENVRSLLGNRRAFEELATGLFDELFCNDLFGNKYLGHYGRQKLLALQRGLAAISDSRMTAEGLVSEIQVIGKEEQLYRLLLEIVKERIRSFYSRYNSSSEQDELRAEVETELQHKGLLTESIAPQLFRGVVVNIKKEAIYLHNLLPEILSSGDPALREDFLDNSGLDRFYVEELEREYCESHQIDPERLNDIRKGLAENTL